MKKINLDLALAKVDFVEVAEDTMKEIEGGCTYVAHRAGGCNGGYFKHYAILEKCEDYTPGYCPNGFTQTPGWIQCPGTCDLIVF